MPRALFGGKSPKALPYNPLPHMEEYLDELAYNEKNAEYIRQVRKAFTHFGNFALEEGLKHPDEIERRHLLRFQSYLAEQTSPASGTKLSLRYRQQLMKAIHYWLNWCVNVEHIEESPWRNIKVGRVGKKPKPLEYDEIDQLFAAHRMQAFSMNPFFYHRRETILTLLYGWGLRINELQSLTVTALDMRQDFIVVKNKGEQGRTKTLPYSMEMKGVVQRYLTHRGAKAVPGEDSLLIDQHGNQMTLQMIRQVISELGQRAGVRINPHRLRDTFGTVMLDNDVPVERIMSMMGHTTKEQTLAYSRVNDPKLKESHDAVMDPILSRLIRKPDEADKEEQ